MMMITSIESYVQAVMNVPALLQNKDLLENLHPRYTELLARCSVTNPNASPQPGANPLDAAIQNLVETGTPVANAPGGSNSAENNNAMNNNSSTVAPGTNTTNRHSIGIAGLLCAKTRTTEFNTNFEAFLVQFSAFLDVADWGQLRLVAGVVTEMAVAITDQMIRRNPILGINLLGNVATRLQAHDKMLTCVHASVLQLCCASYNFKAALPFIIDDFEEFTTDLKSSDNTVHLLSYLYYAGLVHTALKQYPRAIYFFEACTRVPAITLSHVMLESYKKLVLVSLIHSGEVQAPHKSSLQVVSRVLKPSATAYTELAAAFAVGVDALSNCIAKNLDAYRADSNYGLVKQVRAAQVRVSIRKLTRTFLTVSLEDLGKRAVGGGGGAMINLHDQQQGAAGDRGGVGGEAEKVVLGMIEDNSVVAKINQKDGMVRFLDELHEERGVVINGHDGGGSSTKRASILDVIEGKINSCIELNRRINIMNERISTNPEFISKVVVSLDNAGGSGAAGSGSAGSLGSEMMDQGIGGSSSSSSGVNALSSSGGGGGSGLISSSNRGNAAAASSSSTSAAAATGAASSSSSSSSSSRSNNANSNVIGGSGGGAFNT